VATKQEYLDKCSVYQNSIDTILAWEANALKEMSQDPKEAAAQKFALANQMTDLTSYYVALTQISMVMLETRNEDALNNARKYYIKGIAYLEDIVSPYLDVPPSDYQDKLDLITDIASKDRFLLLQKMGIALDLIQAAFGENSKWRWTFVQLEGRHAIVAKNLFDMKNAMSILDMTSPHYEWATYHIRLVKKLLPKLADRYREKYELSGSQVDDFKRGIDFLNAMRRIHILLGESADAELIKKKSDIWASKLEADIKSKKK
jgi:hypothetical protein